MPKKRKKRKSSLPRIRKWGKESDWKIIKEGNNKSYKNVDTGQIISYRRWREHFKTKGKKLEKFASENKAKRVEYWNHFHKNVRGQQLLRAYIDREMRNGNPRYVDANDNELVKLAETDPEFHSVVKLLHRKSNSRNIMNEKVEVLRTMEYTPDPAHYKQK